MRTFRPTRRQCHELFEGVLDLIEQGPPPDSVRVPGTIDVLSYDVETASVDVSYLIWHGEPKTIALVEILSY